MTLSMEDTKLIKWWVEGLYDIHWDMRIHTGGMISIRKVALYSMSHKHKLNTKSSTDTDYVAMVDVMPQLLWTKYFLKVEG